MTNPTSNFGWQMPTSTDLVTDLPADFAVFGQAVDTSLADLKGGTTGQVLSKASNTDMDFTWVAQDDSNAIQNAIVTTKGDLIGATGNATPARLGVGTNGQVLTADSTASTGLAWSTVAAGGMTLLSTTTMSGTSTTVSSISGSYKQLVIQVLDFYPSGTNASFYFRLNGDATSNAYRYLQQQGDSGSPYSTASPQWLFNATGFFVDATQKAADSNAFLWIELPNYADTSTHKFARYQSAWTNAGDNKQTTLSHGYWDSTAAVTSILFSNSGISAAQGTIKIWGVN